MNAVLMLTRNNLALTKKAVESVLSQFIPVELLVFDNGSTDGTSEWLPTNDPGSKFMAWRSLLNQGVSAGWNWGLDYFFRSGCEQVLVLNNDLVLPPWMYRELLSYDAPFVTGVAVDNTEFTERPPIRCPLTPHPDFSCFMIRRQAWEKIGRFDERMKFYASDCDYHIRGHKLGVDMMKANCPFFHASSSTLNLATPEERALIETQANADRAVFRSLYGCLPGTAEYEALFG